MDIEYKLILSNKFDKTFSQLDKDIQKQIVERLKDLSKNPKTGKPLKGKFKGR
jgi:mRNA-degrading endonuclease RelE of RelBE toxin-antitoxin system